MILPQTYSFALILMALSLVCWGSWVNTFKLAGKYRFEVYYMDFAIGCLAIALVYAFTFGNLGFDGFSFLDDLEHAGKRQWLFGFVAGVIFNLGNMLLLSAVSVGGMAIAFPIGIGMAIIVSSLLGFVTKPSSNLPLLFSGCALIAASIVVAAIAYNIMGVIRHEALARAGKAKSTRRPTTVKAVILALVGGILLGSFFPMMQKATEGEVGLGPYAVMVVFSIGIFFSTFVFSLFFMNLPVEGEPVELIEYFRATLKQHLLGFLGGGIWATGAVAGLAVGLAPASAHMPPAAEYMVAQAYPLLAALWGLLVWKEFSDGDGRVKLSAGLMMLLFAGGLTLVAVAPLYLRKG
jgi:glucose uptake protein